MKITRGVDDKGAIGARCVACHRDENNDTGVPGAPHWQLAPLSMGWQGLSVGELCTVLKDPKLNGNRTLADLIKHMDEDKLVLWGWGPGKDIDGKDREPVPIPHAEFVGLDGFPKLENGIVKILIDSFNRELEGLATRHPNVLRVDFRGKVGNRWHDELHPSREAFAELGAMVERAILAAP